MSTTTVYSIGHSNHAIETFVARLHQHSIGCLVDVRSVPYSRYSPHFSKQALEAHLQEDGIRYVYLGDRLGGRPDAPECYDLTGSVDYDYIADQTWFADGLREFLDLANEARTTMMCSEEDPTYCHRNLLIADAILKRAASSVFHIRGDGRLEPAELKPRQTRLF